MITEPLTQGVYVFTAIAKNPVNDEEAIAEIRLTVRGINVCPNDKKTVADTLMIMSLIENYPHNSIMEMEQDDCSFEINAVIPNDKRNKKILHKCLKCLRILFFLIFVFCRIFHN